MLSGHEKWGVLRKVEVSAQQLKKKTITSTAIGSGLLIAFIITVLVLNNSSKKIISINSKIVDSQNALLEQNKKMEEELRRSK